MSDIPQHRLENLFASLKEYIVENDEKNAKKVEELKHDMDHRFTEQENKADQRAKHVEERLGKLESKVLGALGNGLYTEIKQIKKWVSQGNTKFYNLLQELKKMVIENTDWRKQKQWEEIDGEKRTDRRRTDKTARFERFWMFFVSVFVAILAAFLSKFV